MECYIPLFFSCVCVSFRKGFISWNMLLFCDRHFYSLSCLLPAFLVLYSFSTPCLEWLQHFHSCSYPWSWQAGGIVMSYFSFISFGFLIFPSTFPSLPCSQAYVPLYLMYSLSETVLLPGWPLSSLGFDPPTLTCFQCIGIPLYLSGHDFVLLCLSSWCPSIHSQSCKSLSPVSTPDFLWKGTLLEFGCFSMTNYLEVVIFSVLLKAWPRIILFAFFVFYIFVCF